MQEVKEEEEKKEEVLEIKEKEEMEIEDQQVHHHEMSDTVLKVDKSKIKIFSRGAKGIYKEEGDRI
jgi:biopolymer transport protein ExbD